MNGYLLDTNVISESTRKTPHSGVIAFLQQQPLSTLYLSSISMGEIELGIERLTEPAKRAALRQWLSTHLLPDYSGRILPIDHEVMMTWARMILSTGRSAGQIPCMDALIAATALHHHLVLVTRNTKDIAGFGVPYLNPWTS